MKLSVYISQTYIEYVLGEASGKNVKVTKAGRVELDEVSLQCGENMQDENVLKENLEKLKTEVSVIPRNVEVLLAASMVFTKLVEVPFLPQDKLLEITKSEMQEFVDAKKEYVYDYGVLLNRVEGKKAGLLNCVAMERQMLDKYTAIFQECHIPVNSLDISISAQVQMTRRILPDNGHTYILGIMDGFTMFTSLYVKGKLAYTNSARVSIRENLGIITELIRVLSSFIQFNKSQRNDTDVEKIYLVGLHENEREFCHNIQNALAIETTLLPEYPFVSNATGKEFSTQEFFYTTGNLFRK